jgi:hypothetical protein
MANHKVVSLIVIIIIVAVVAVIGLLLGTEGITGATVADTITCNDDSDCNDRIKATTDTCKNPGTIHSLCVNKPTN